MYSSSSIKHGQWHQSLSMHGERLVPLSMFDTTYSGPVHIRSRMRSHTFASAIGFVQFISCPARDHIATRERSNRVVALLVGSTIVTSLQTFVYIYITTTFNVT